MKRFSDGSGKLPKNTHDDQQLTHDQWEPLPQSQPSQMLPSQPTTTHDYNGANSIPGVESEPLSLPPPTFKSTLEPPNNPSAWPDAAYTTRHSATHTEPCQVVTQNRSGGAKCGYASEAASIARICGLTGYFIPGCPLELGSDYAQDVDIPATIGRYGRVTPAFMSFEYTNPHGPWPSAVSVGNIAPSVPIPTHSSGPNGSWISAIDEKPAHARAHWTKGNDSTLRILVTKGLTTFHDPAEPDRWKVYAEWMAVSPPLAQFSTGSWTAQSGGR